MNIAATNRTYANSLFTTIIVLMSVASVVAAVLLTYISVLAVNGNGANTSSNFPAVGVCLLGLVTVMGIGVILSDIKQYDYQKSQIGSLLLILGGTVLFLAGTSSELYDTYSLALSIFCYSISLVGVIWLGFIIFKKAKKYNTKELEKAANNRLYLTLIPLFPACLIIVYLMVGIIFP